MPTTIQLKSFTVKTSPVPADIVYLGDSADSFDEVQSTIAELIGAYPALLSIGALSTIANEIIYTTDVNTYTTAPITTMGLAVLANPDLPTLLNVGIDTGTADNYIVTLPIAPSSYYNGLEVIFNPLVTNLTFSPVINVNGLGSVGIGIQGTSAVAIGDIANEQPCMLIYSTNSGQFNLLTPSISYAITKNVLTGNGFWLASDSGVAANAYVANLANVQSYAGEELDPIILVLEGIANSNTGASTLSILNDGHSPYAIITVNGSCVGGEMIAGNNYFFFFIPNIASYFLLNPSNLGAIQANSLQLLTNTGILDQNGNPILAINAQVSAVNYFEMYNNVSGAAPILNSLGADTDIGQTFAAKGAGLFRFSSTLATNQVEYSFSGSNSNFFDFPVTSGANVFSWPVDTGTVAITETGTWIPIDASGGSLSFSTANGTYIRIGNMVIATAYVVYPATADANQAIIGGLPIETGSTNEKMGGSVSKTTVATLANALTLTSNTAFSLFTNAGVAVLNSAMTASTNTFQLIYFL